MSQLLLKFVPGQHGRHRGGNEDTGGDSNGMGKGNKQQSTKSGGGNGDGNNNDESDVNDYENERRRRRQRRRPVMAGGKTIINNQLKKWQRQRK